MSLENQRNLRVVKNIGLRPYNLPLERTREIALAQDDINRLGILVMKPGYFSPDPVGLPIQHKVEGLITSSQLDILATSCVSLSTEQVHTLYPDIFGAHVVDRTGTLGELQLALEDYMSDYVFSYLVNGVEALTKLGIIKNAVRLSTGYVKGSIKVRNAVHVSDREDLIHSLEVLFDTSNRTARLRH